MSQDPKKPLGRILLQQRALDQQELDRALAAGGDAPLATRLTESGAVSEIAALKALSEQTGVPGIDLSQICIRLADLSVLPREIAIRHRLIPVLVRGDRIFVAMAAPTEKKVIDELEFVTGKRVFAYVALAGPLQRVINAAYDMRESGEAYYVGPACPPEILRKAGLEVPPQAAAPQAPPPPRPPAPPPAPAARPAASAPPAPSSEPAFRSVLPSSSREPAPNVVVDDAMGRVAASHDVSDIDFGESSSDLSVVTALPMEALEAKADGRPTILVVDDEPDIRKLLRRVFEERRYRVIEADRGLLALRIVKEQPPDVMILDAMLPEVHGFDIARRMKSTQRYAHIPIVMVSAVYRGWRFAEDLKASYGVEAYVEKPFKVADVLKAVENALAARTQKSDADRLSGQAEKCLADGIAAYHAGDIVKAIEHLQNGAKIDPLAYRLHFHLGLLYGKQGQLYDAIQELETALNVNGKHFPALKNLAVLYQKAGFRNKAIETWERALAVAPDEPTRQSIKEHLLGLL